MKTEIINYERQKAMEKRLGCTFCDNGDYAEMSMDISDYREMTKPIDGAEYGFYRGDIGALKTIVAQVEEEWSQFFDGNAPVFCGFINGEPASFCIVEEDNECIIARSGIRVGSIGCVGTLPQYRGRGIGLRMVDLATVYLRENGFDKAYISYTAIDRWYAKLGYETFARFSLNK